MNKQRFNKFRQLCLELFLDGLWLLGMGSITSGVNELLGLGSALIVGGGFCVASAYFKTRQIRAI